MLDSVMLVPTLLADVNFAPSGRLGPLGTLVLDIAVLFILALAAIVASALRARTVPVLRRIVGLWLVAFVAFHAAFTLPFAVALFTGARTEAEVTDTRTDARGRHFVTVKMGPPSTASASFEDEVSWSAFASIENARAQGPVLVPVLCAREYPRACYLGYAPHTNARVMLLGGIAALLGLFLSWRSYDRAVRLAP